MKKNMDLADLKLSDRILNILRNNNIKTVKELCRHTAFEYKGPPHPLMFIKGLGKLSIVHIEIALAAKGLSLRD